MSRVTELTQLIKRDLRDYNLNDVNSFEIFHALYEGQKFLATIEDCIESKQEIEIVAGQGEYDFLFNSGADAEVSQNIIKRVKSFQQPSTWNPLEFPVDTEFDLIKSYYSLTSPEYAIIRNNKLEIYGVPGSGDAGEILTLQVYLKAPINKPNDTNEIETPFEFDTALRYYADWFLLPINSQDKNDVWNVFETERVRSAGNINKKINQVRSPKVNW